MSKPRAAVCFYGLVGGRGGKNGAGGNVDFERCARSMHKKIIDPNSADVFIHSWSVECEDGLRKAYEPKSAFIEPQRLFNLASLADLARMEKQEKGFREFITRSRWYTMQQAVRLKHQYELEHSFVYDWVMVCRLDLMFSTEINFSKLDNKYFYAANLNKIRYRKDGQKYGEKFNDSDNRDCLQDMWFIGNSKLMDRFCDLYDRYDICHANTTNPHVAAWRQLDYVAGNPRKITKFMLYRWFDFELYREKYC